MATGQSRLRGCHLVQGANASISEPPRSTTLEPPLEAPLIASCFGGSEHEVLPIAEEEDKTKDMMHDEGKPSDSPCSEPS